MILGSAVWVEGKFFLFNLCVCVCVCVCVCFLGVWGGLLD